MKEQAKYMVIATAGRSEFVVWDNMTYDEAWDYCETENWVYDLNDGLYWDLYIQVM